jgi:hypothetical protein
VLDCLTPPPQWLHSRCSGGILSQRPVSSAPQ